MRHGKRKLFSRRVLFSAAMLTMLGTGCPCGVFAAVDGVQAVTQTGTVKGTVFDTLGEPVIGANIMVKGTTTGCITDFNGQFSLATGKGTLVVSFIGYKTQEIEVNGNETDLKIILSEDAELLQEVVVVGYGTQKKESMTGAVTVV